MKKTFGILLALVLIVGIASPALALSTRTVTRTNGTAAYGFWTTTEGDWATDTYIEADATQMGTDIYSFRCTYNLTNYEEYTCWDGYLFTTASVFTMDKKMKTATLAPIDVDFINFMDGSMMTMNISASWNGLGIAQKGSLHVTDRFGNTMFKLNNRSTIRGAEATGMFGTETLGTSVDGAMAQFKSMEIYMEK